MSLDFIKFLSFMVRLTHVTFRVNFIYNNRYNCSQTGCNNVFIFIYYENPFLKINHKVIFIQLKIF